MTRNDNDQQKELRLIGIFVFLLLVGGGVTNRLLPADMQPVPRLAWILVGAIAGYVGGLAALLVLFLVLCALGDVVSAVLSALVRTRRRP